MCVCIEKGVKGNGDRKENKGGSPFEEETGEEVKNALQDEQGHESPKPTPKPKGDDDVKGPGTFRWEISFRVACSDIDIPLKGNRTRNYLTSCVPGWECQNFIVIIRSIIASKWLFLRIIRTWKKSSQFQL